MRKSDDFLLLGGNVPVCCLLGLYLVTTAVLQDFLIGSEIEVRYICLLRGVVVAVNGNLQVPFLLASW